MNLNLQYRLAAKEDVIAIVQLLSDDNLGSSRESVPDELPDSYFRAFGKILSDPNHELTVVESSGEIIGTFHLTYIQYLTYQGGLRAQIEAVMVNSKFRGKGIGTKMINYAINRAKKKGCHLIQLTSDKRRPDAIRFYESIGFVATHQGMKLKFT